MKQFFNGIVAVLLGSLSLHALGQSHVAANKDAVEVLSEPSKKGQVLSKIKKGDELKSEGREGMYWKVKLSDGRAGFVSVLQVRPKSGGDSSLSKAIQKSVKEGRDSDLVDGARARSAVMGVRGFDEEDKVHLLGNVRPNLRMVYSMEDAMVDAGQLNGLGNQVFAEVEQSAQRLTP